MKSFIKKLPLILCLMSILAAPAKAGFELGMLYYDQGDHEKAFREFETAARYGKHLAQYNLGVMYYKGEFVEKDVLEAYAWFALSAQDEAGAEDAVHKKLYKTLSQEEQAAADKLYQALLSQYGQEALDKALEPVFLGISPASERLRLAKRVVPRYPRRMSERGRSGWVDVFFTVDKDGTTRDHTVFFTSDRAFTAAALEALRASVYEPQTVAGQPVAVNGLKMRYLFSLEGAEFDERRIRKFINKAKEQAVEGDASDKLQYAYMLKALPSYTGRHDVFEDNPNEWYFEAAKTGSSSAGFFLGRNLLYGNKCEVDTDKSYAWLVKAAATLTDAQYTLALELLSGVRFERDLAKVRYWLNVAATNGSANAQLRYAWILATSSEDSHRNGEKAAHLFGKVDEDHPDRQTYYEVAAAVAAENGHFKVAADWQKKALEDARTLDLPDASILERLARYQAKQPYREVL
jgi:TonB family protein